MATPQVVPPAAGLAQTSSPDIASPVKASATEKRAASLRVRRPPKRLLSPPAPAPSRTTTTRARATPSSASPQLATAAHSPTPSPTPTPIPAKERSAKASPSKSATAAAARATAAAASAASPPSRLATVATANANAAASGSKAKSAAAAAQSGSLKGQAPPSSDPAEQHEVEATGVGKRKRKPSTMIRPPATITTAPQPSAATIAARAKAYQLPGEHASSAAPAPASSPPASALLAAKPKIKVRHSTGSTDSTTPRNTASALAPYSSSSGYESDGGKMPLSHSQPDGDIEREATSFADFDAIEAPPLIFQRSGKVAFRRPLGLGRSAARTCASGTHSVSAARSTSQSHPRKRNAYVSPRKVGHHRTKSLPSLASGPAVVVPSLKRSSADVEADRYAASSALSLDAGAYEDGEDEDDEEEEDDDEEEDFHRAMLDGDFDALDEWPSTRSSSDVDTPATTPRSPQSACEPLTAEAQRPIKKEDTPSTSEPGSDAAQDVCDAVFSHALAPSSRRVKSHAGLLTLSLPYDEASSTSASSHSPMADLRRDAFSPSPFATPTSRREARRSHVLSSLEQGEANVAGLTRAISVTPRGEEDQRSTSPPMSPTHAFLSLAAVSKGTGLPGTTSMVSSPFLAAVRRSALSRAGSPDTVPAFSLPAAVHAGNELTAHASGDATLTADKDLGTDAFSTASLDSPLAASEGRYSREQSSLASSDGLEEDNSSPITVYSPAPDMSTECEADDPVFGLPEAMGLDDIDVAYGGSGQAPSVLLPALGKNNIELFDDGEQQASDVTAEEVTTASMPRSAKGGAKRKVASKEDPEDRDRDGERTSPSPRQRRCVTRTGIDVPTKIATPTRATARSPTMVRGSLPSAEGKRTTRTQATASSPTAARSTRKRSTATK
ncbi:unnamed protein product [Parajaminaea phylloscopi]